METREYIESGILELYVYGLLDEAENQAVAKMARDHKEVADEIASIETAIVNLSTSFSPYLSAENFEKIKLRLELKHYEETPVVEPKRRTNWAALIGWTMAVIFLAGAGYLFMQWNNANMEIVNADAQTKELRDTIALFEVRNKAADSLLAILRHPANEIVYLEGKTAPEAYAQIYWNKETQAVHVDASGLPEPPEGQVYQVWSLRLRPFEATSIGLLENFNADSHKIFGVSPAAEAEAFAITLEPAGGSETPTPEQMYVLGNI